MQETIMLWVTIIGIIVIPIVGAFIKDAIFKKIDANTCQQDKDRELFFKKLDEIKVLYVRKDMCDQSMTFHAKETDTKFENILARMNDKFEAVESKIEDIKILIIKNFNTQQQESRKG